MNTPCAVHLCHRARRSLLALRTMRSTAMCSSIGLNGSHHEGDGCPHGFSPVFQISMDRIGGHYMGEDNRLHEAVRDEFDIH